MLGLIDSINIYQIRPSSLSVRDIGNTDELAMSIKENGLLHPILVRPVDNYFEIVAGKRRFHACKQLGLRKIPCHIVDLPDKQAFELALIENIQRKMMNPIEEAEAYRKYIQDRGWGGVSELAKRIGKSQEYVTKRLKLLELPIEIQKEVVNRRIKSSVAEELAFIKDKEEQSRLAQLVAERHITIRKLRELSSSKDKHELDEQFCIVSDRRNQILEDNHHVFDKSIITLKLTLNRLDGILNITKDDWVVHELITQHRTSIHSQIDLLIKQRKKYARVSQQQKHRDPQIASWQATRISIS